MNADFAFAFFLATLLLLLAAFLMTYILEAWRLAKTRPAVRIRGIRRGFLR